MEDLPKVLALGSENWSLGLLGLGGVISLVVINMVGLIPVLIHKMVKN